MNYFRIPTLKLIALALLSALVIVLVSAPGVTTAKSVGTPSQPSFKPVDHRKEQEYLAMRNGKTSTSAYIQAYNKAKALPVASSLPAALVKRHSLANTTTATTRVSGANSLPPTGENWTSAGPTALDASAAQSYNGYAGFSIASPY